MKQIKSFFSHVFQFLYRYLFLVILVSLIGILFVVYTYLVSLTQEAQVSSFPFSLPKLSELPQTAPSSQITLSASAAVVLDDDSKVILYEKNPRLLFSPASTTKLITALIALETFKPDDLLTVKSSGIEGTVVGFIPGQKVTVKDVLYGMLLPSGNDAAHVIADNYPGGEPAFVTAMNTKAAQLQLLNTHFADPAGLLDDDTYTTVIDLAHLASVAIKNPLIAQIVNTKNYVVHTTSGVSYPVENTNKLLGLFGINGIKTGHTEGAKDVLVTSVKRGSHTIIIVVMRSDDRFADTKNLVDTVVSSITYSALHL